jgi:ribosomal protein S18 acetylase RimI-like enzyme
MQGTRLACLPRSLPYSSLPDPTFIDNEPTLEVPYSVRMTSTIRTGQPSDVGSVLSLWTESDAEPTHTDNSESLYALLARDPDSLVVEVDGAEIVGSVIAAWDGWRGSSYRLVVSSSHRRQGMASQLLVYAEARLTTVGAVRLQAIVTETNPQASGFWMATGWEQQIQRLRFVKG